MEKKDDTYRVCVVKRNDGNTVRLCDLNSLLELIYTGKDDRLEIELIAKKDPVIEDFKNELWVKGSMIWFSPLHPRIWEATCEDEQAKKENDLV